MAHAEATAFLQQLGQRKLSAVRDLLEDGDGAFTASRRSRNAIIHTLWESKSAQDEDVLEWKGANDVHYLLRVFTVSQDDLPLHMQLGREYESGHSGDFVCDIISLYVADKNFTPSDLHETIRKLGPVLGKPSVIALFELKQDGNSHSCPMIRATMPQNSGPQNLQTTTKKARKHELEEKNRKKEEYKTAKKTAMEYRERHAKNCFEAQHLQDLPAEFVKVWEDPKNTIHESTKARFTHKEGNLKGDPITAAAFHPFGRCAETMLLLRVLQNANPGDKLEVRAFRNGKLIPPCAACLARIYIVALYKGVEVTLYLASQNDVDVSTTLGEDIKEHFSNCGSSPYYPQNLPKLLVEVEGGDRGMSDSRK